MNDKVDAAQDTSREQTTREQEEYAEIAPPLREAWANLRASIDQPSLSAAELFRRHLLFWSLWARGMARVNRERLQDELKLGSEEVLLLAFQKAANHYLPLASEAAENADEFEEFLRELTSFQRLIEKGPLAQLKTPAIPGHNRRVAEYVERRSVEDFVLSPSYQTLTDDQFIILALATLRYGDQVDAAVVCAILQSMAVWLEPPLTTLLQAYMATGLRPGLGVFGPEYTGDWSPELLARVPDIGLPGAERCPRLPEIP